jgi:hypothetical protein
MLKMYTSKYSSLYIIPCPDFGSAGDGDAAEAGKGRRMDRFHL